MDISASAELMESATTIMNKSNNNARILCCTTLSFRLYHTLLLMLGIDTSMRFYVFGTYYYARRLMYDE